ncbi:MAG: 50S ribosomal protein L35, partial [Aeromonas veronii]
PKFMVSAADHKRVVACLPYA